MGLWRYVANLMPVRPSVVFPPSLGSFSFPSFNEGLSKGEGRAVEGGAGGAGGAGAAGA